MVTPAIKSYIVILNDIYRDGRTDKQKDILRNILCADYLELIAQDEADLPRITDIMQLYT